MQSNYDCTINQSYDGEVCLMQFATGLCMLHTVTSTRGVAPPNGNHPKPVILKIEATYTTGAYALDPCIGGAAQEQGHRKPRRGPLSTSAWCVRCKVSGTVAVAGSSKVEHGNGISYATLCHCYRLCAGTIVL